MKSFNMDAAKSESTEKLLQIAKEAKEKKATKLEAWAKVFPSLDYNYSQVSAVLQERGYHVRWSSDTLEDDFLKERSKNKELEKENRMLKEKMAAMQNNVQELRLSLSAEKTVYMSLPVSASVEKEWKETFGMINNKRCVDDAALMLFLSKVKKREIIIVM